MDGVDLQHLTDQGGGAGRDVGRHVEVAGGDLLEEGGDVVVIEGQTADQQHVEDDTATPDVDLGPGVELAGDDLGGGVVGAAAAGLEEVAVGHDVAEAEIGDLDVFLAVDEEVLGLEVAVDDLVAMAVLHGADDLLEELAGLGVVAAAPLDEVVEQLALGVLEDHDDVGLGGDDGVEFDDVGMAQQLQVLDLAFDAAHHVAGKELAPGDDLEGDLPATGLVNRQLHLAKGAFAQNPDGLILIQPLHIPGRRRGRGGRRVRQPRGDGTGAVALALGLGDAVSISISIWISGIPFQGG
ncbi:hypothetical protein BDW42DRAFT_174170 [Aspergillus taichungensis]|uniref:NAD-specific glutamate dehydrogenase-domain-containing protein n=1 Tax=Aspergillus taichungensis TaxID=482145 RepID=A0A2J5HNJ0_9EURO|nr:hypothetical protein BDW42DRAFT_174170 [Aspergillus taichungensis]